MIKAVIYVRVSTREQQEEGFSLEAQLKLLREYALRNNIEVVQEYVEAQSAKAAGRIQFGLMMKLLKTSKDVKTILAEKTDRLYRNFKDYVDIDPDTTGIQVIFVKENTTLSKDSRSNDKFIQTIKVAVAKNYVDNLREETSKGLLAKAEAGEFPSKAPQGYLNDKETKRIVPNPQTSRLVKRLFELYASGGYSLDTVSERIAKEGLRAVGGRCWRRSKSVQFPPVVSVQPAVFPAIWA